MIIPNIWKVTKFMFQTTNQISSMFNLHVPPCVGKIREIQMIGLNLHLSQFNSPYVFSVNPHPND